MPEVTAAKIPPGKVKLDRLLLLSLALPPLAAGISTIVGYSVAHWITLVAHKRTGFLVSASCFVLCAASAWLAWDAQAKLNSPDETVPEDGRRLFMAKFALLLSAMCALVVLAGILVVIILQPYD